VEGRSGRVVGENIQDTYRKRTQLFYAKLWLNTIKIQRCYRKFKLHKTEKGKGNEEQRRRNALKREEKRNIREWSHPNASWWETTIKTYTRWMKAPIGCPEALVAENVFFKQLDKHNVTLEDFEVLSLGKRNHRALLLDFEMITDAGRQEQSQRRKYDETNYRKEPPKRKCTKADDYPRRKRTKKNLEAAFNMYASSMQQIWDKVSNSGGISKEELEGILNILEDGLNDVFYY
jgi:hypothetical protein